MIVVGIVEAFIQIVDVVQIAVWNIAMVRVALVFPLVGGKIKITDDSNEAKA